MKYTLKKYEESLNHFKEQVCKHCCEWNKSLRHCNTCVTATAKEALQMAIEAMEKQATSNYTSEWIPVSEKLPEESGTYIVNAIENCIVHVAFAKWMKRMKKWNLTGSRSYWKVTAWQPLPEPWKGEVNE